MVILGKHLTSKTESLVLQLEQSFHYPVEYLPVETLPGRNAAGSVDIYHQTGKYRVWLESNLPKEAFEADLLHELHHITQGELGYPTVFNKPSSDFYSRSRSSVEDVGSHLGSVVLDIDVNNWLSEHGYSYHFFASNNYQALIQSQQKFPLLRDPLNFAELCLALVHVSLYFDNSDTSKLFAHYSEYVDVISTAKSIRNELLDYTYDSPQIAMLAMDFLIDSLNLWKWYYVSSPHNCVRTKREYDCFRSAVLKEIINVVYIPLKISRQPVSAGDGIYLGAEEMETISVQSNSLTKRAIFAVKVSGDSMKPRFSDEDILLVEDAKDINVGEIGVFTMDGNGYVKQRGNDELISLNPSYPPIPMNASIQCNGRIIGKLRSAWIGQGNDSE